MATGLFGGGGLMRQVADRALWLGHAGDLRDASAVLAAGIDAVMELADSEPERRFLSRRLAEVS